MRKSISKLIVAGLTLAMTATAYAAPVSLVKATKVTDNKPASAVQTQTVAKPKGGVRNLFQMPKTDKHLTQVNHRAAKPSMNSVLPQLKAPAKLGAQTQVYGSVIYSANPEFEYGIYSLPTGDASNELEMVAYCPDIQGVYGACLADGKYYVNEFLDYLFFQLVAHAVYDAETWEQEEFFYDEDTDISTCALDMTYDEATGQIYGCFYTPDGQSFMLATQDKATFKTTYIGDLEAPLNTIVADANGQLYGITMYDGLLYAIDKETAEMTLIGDTGVSPTYLAGGTIDTKTGVFYWTVVDNYGGYLYTVDLQTGEATLVSDFAYGEEVVGVFIPAPAADDAAPGAVDNLSVVFEGDKHVGTISFNLPSEKFDGSQLLEVVEYTITRNGEVIKTGEGMPGAEIQYVDVVPESGNYLYAVYCTLNGLDGPKSKVELWVGTDAPVVATGLNLNYANGAFNLTWNPVTESVHAGTLSGNITYTVTLYGNDGVVTSEADLKDCSWSFEKAAPSDLTVYYATVKAYTDKASSGVASSNSIVLGSANTPYYEGFDNEDSLNYFTIIDGNGDGYTWQYNGDGRVSVRYNSEEDMDDWLITPGIKLEAGKQYTFKAGVAPISSFFMERVEVCMGSTATVAGMDKVIVEPTDLEAATTVSAKVTVAESGDYYFGVHGISDPDMYYVLVDFVEVSEGYLLGAPAPCATAFVTPDRKGALEATVSYVTPAKTIGGEDTDLTKVEIYRDGELIYTDDAPEAGKKAQYVDNTIPANGTYTWTIIAYNAVGKGEPVDASAFVGVGVPVAPEAAEVVENGNTGEVVISWTAPSEDVDGHYLDPSNITYTIYDMDGYLVADNVAETSITYQALEGEGNEFVYYYVYAVTEAGESSPTYTQIISIGTPLSLPIAESFDGASLTLPLAVDLSGGAYWTLFTEEDLEIPDADGTDGMLAMVGEYNGDYAQIFTPKIALDVDVPVLTFSTFGISNSNQNELYVLVRDCETGAIEDVAAVTQGQDEVGEWNIHAVSLKDYAGKNVQVYFYGVVINYQYILIDNIKIAQPVDIDLVAANIKAPAKVKANEEFNVTVEVYNAGAKTVDNYSVELSLNGEVIATVAGEAVEALESTTVAIPYTFSPVCADDNVFSAKVVCEGDEDLTNNATAEVAVDVVMPNLPVATELTATMQGESVALAWNEPIMSDLGVETVTEDFESYPAFSIDDLGDWMLVDEDGAQIGGFNGIELPGAPQGAEIAYYLMNYVELNLNESFTAHSGEQYLMTMYNSDGSQQADWLISPALSGNAQTISFFAKSYTDSYGYESFAVYYSTTDRQLDSFELLDEVDEVPVDWTEFRYDLPEGAKYFAVVCTSQDVFTMFLDDVTYEPAGAKEIELSLIGYNIYRNGVKVNEAPVAETSYVDAEGSKTDVYVVTVVYAEGESAPSNEAVAETTAIDSVKATKATVKVVNHTIVVTGAEGTVSVFTADGKQLYSSEAKAVNKVNVVPGVYVVNAGKSTNKVVVK